MSTRSGTLPTDTSSRTEKADPSVKSSIRTNSGCHIVSNLPGRLAGWDESDCGSMVTEGSIAESEAAYIASFAFANRTAVSRVFRINAF